MKTSIKKLQKLAAIKHDRRCRKKQQQNHQQLVEDELARATQDMNDMKDCYDRLLSAAAAAANSVYEMSESLREMGDCLLEKTALNDDEESGKVLLMLGKVQFELQKLVDGYRSHIFQTITIPSESLLNELHIVEEMKKSCDEKRAMYEEMMKKQRDKGRLRNSKGECFQSPQLQEAQTEYDEEANMFVFRMKSLKQGQSRSFLTQASRHHAAQLYFFKKAVRSLEAVEPHVRSLAEQLHIDYQFSEIKHDGFSDDDDGSDEEDDTEDGSETHDYHELSFDYRETNPVQVHTSKKMEMDKSDPMDSPYSKMDSSEVINIGRRSFSFQRGGKALSKSAPLFPDKKLDTAEQTGHLRSLPTHKFTSYVLPTPDEAKSPSSGKLFNGVPQTRQSISNPWHSSPLNQNQYEKLRAEDNLSGPIILDARSVLKESNTTRFNPLSSQSVEGHSSERLDPNLASYAKKARRQSFSGPLTRKPLPNSLNFTASGPIVSSALPLHFSGSLLHIPVPQPSSSPRVSSVSPMTTSAPRISELHELPRPPAHLVVRQPVNRIAHSGPIISRSRELSTTSLPKFTAASALTTPPQALSRSYSIPSGGSSDVALQSSLGSPRNSRMEADVSSPLSPITLPNVQAASLYHR